MRCCSRLKTSKAKGLPREEGEEKYFWLLYSTLQLKGHLKKKGVKKFNGFLSVKFQGFGFPKYVQQKITTTYALSWCQ